MEKQCKHLEAKFPMTECLMQVLNEMGCKYTFSSDMAYDRLNVEKESKLYSMYVNGSLVGDVHVDVNDIRYDLQDPNCNPYDIMVFMLQAMGPFWNNANDLLRIGDGK